MLRVLAMSLTSVLAAVVRADDVPDVGGRVDFSVFHCLLRVYLYRCVFAARKATHLMLVIHATGPHAKIECNCNMPTCDTQHEQALHCWLC
jgi:hypothetical protein